MGDKGKAKGPQGEYHIDGTNTEDQRNAAHGNTDRSALIGCRKCGYPGHMTYECRNGVKTGSSSYAMIHCDIDSTSSDDEDVRMLREIKESIKEKKRLKKLKKERKKKAKESKSRKSRRSYSDSQSDSD